MLDQNSEIVKTVTLLLGTKRFDVDKKKLIEKSQYFATLLSTTYKDYRLLEHNINYEIPLTSFQDFINWIDNDINILKMFHKDNLGHLLLLLELSILFVVDDLTKNITDILEKYYLLPENVLNIWLLAQELGLRILRDLCFAVCLDRFTELPLDMICELSRQNFLKLVGNINLRVTNVSIDADSYLLDIAQKWMKDNQDTIPLDILKKTGPKVYPSIISYNYSQPSVVDNEFYIHCWDGDKLFELTTFRYPEDIINNKKKIIGMQITIRGHNLYLSGGEFGIGSGKFNKNVWRYSLISKNWFLETTMPRVRRHMIAAFVQDSLLLAGGVGLYRQKLQSLDIYNIHKGKWFKGMDIPTEFVTPPDHYVVKKKLIIIDHYKIGVYPKFIYVYNFEQNKWQKANENYQLLKISDLCMIMPNIIIELKIATCYIEINKPDRIKLKNIVAICDSLPHNCKLINSNKNSLTLNSYFCSTLSNTDIYEDNALICFENNKCTIISLIGKDFQWDSMPIQNPNKFHSLSLNSRIFFLNLMDPTNLYINSILNSDCKT